MNYDRFRKYIIVDGKDYRPMAWEDNPGQLCFCDSEKSRHPHPVALYGLKTARKHIRCTKRNRKKWNMEPGEYLLMPVAPRLKKIKSNKLSVTNS